MRVLLLVLTTLVSLNACKGSEAPKHTAPTVKPAEVAPVEENTDTTNAALGPMDSIKELDRKIETYKTGKNLTEAELEANRKLKSDIIRGTFDLAQLCKLSLATHWDEINDTQRKQFVELMTQLLERRAILSKEHVATSSKPYQSIYKSETFLDDEKTKSLVATKILVPSEKIDLDINYKLQKTPKGWKIFDVIVDDSSLVLNYQYQFDAIIKKSGFNDLIDRMKKKLAQFES